MVSYNLVGEDPQGNLIDLAFFSSPEAARDAIVLYVSSYRWVMIQRIVLGVIKTVIHSQKGMV